MNQSAPTLPIQKDFEQFASAALESDRDYGQPVSAVRLIGINAIALAATVEPKLGRHLSDAERQWVAELSASLASAAFSLSSGETIRASGSSLVGFNLLH